MRSAKVKYVIHCYTFFRVGIILITLIGVLHLFTSESMPDMNIVCEKCKADKFDVKVATTMSNIVSSITCVHCGHPVKVSAIVVFMGEVYLSDAYKTPTELKVRRTVNRIAYGFPANDAET